MLELGENSQQAHENTGRFLLNSKADKVFLYGKESAATAGVLSGGNVNFVHTCDMDELSGALDAYVRGGDLVLLKGSRGCALERLCPVLVDGGAA
jgi:UDP-N-acetylmuramoyl-tripeptide--D-alanyl-D-alanine ligase